MGILVSTIYPLVPMKLRKLYRSSEDINCEKLLGCLSLHQSFKMSNICLQKKKYIHY